MIGYDKDALGRIMKMTEAGTEVSKEFERKHENFIPKWVVWAWYISYGLSIALVVWAFIHSYNSIVNG
jgi:hypothetical protein